MQQQLYEEQSSRLKLEDELAELRAFAEVSSHLSNDEKNENLKFRL